MLRFERDYEQSLALHAAVAEELREHPEILDRARRKVGEWLARGGRSAPLLRMWQEVLSKSLDDVVGVLVDRSEESAWLRKASPFAGVLTPKRRLEILREVRRRERVA
jgi:hypothetical protein